MNKLQSQLLAAAVCSAFFLTPCAAVVKDAVPSAADKITRTPVKERKLRYKNILLRDFRTVKDGQVVNFNIGTAAHGPATLNVLQKYLPDSCNITLWADAPLAPELAAMMQRRFPDIKIVHGDLEQEPSAELLAAVDNSDLFLISSGSGIAGSVKKSMEQYQKRTGKPVAAYAIGCTEALLPYLENLEFVWLRDPVAAQIAKKSSCPLQGFAPDAVFDFDAVDQVGAEQFMRENNLQPNQFICCIPGQRYTPRWQFFNSEPDQKKIAENDRFEEHDNAVLRNIITIAVREYGMKVLICPEQVTEMALIRPRIYDRLPQDVQANCVPMDKMWAPDTALAIYKASRGVFGVEIHSQVMAIGNNIPGVLFYPREFGSKGKMWETVGLAEWLIYTDEPNYAQKAEAALRDILENPEQTAEKLRLARKFIDKSNQEAIRKAFLY